MPQFPVGHATSHAHEAAQLMSPHALPAPHVTSQRPTPQRMSPHALPALHITLHAPVWHVTSPHALAAPHVTVHAAVPQLMAPHALVELHAIVHEAAAPHEIVPHAFAEPQVMLQLQPIGHATSLPLPATVHVIAAALHDVHCGGQLASTPGFPPTTQ